MFEINSIFEKLYSHFVGVRVQNVKTLMAIGLKKRLSNIYLH